MNILPAFTSTFYPWITLFLAALICSIHIFVYLAGSPAAFRDSYGFTPGEYHTYITYAFIHTDLRHLLQNTIELLIFGTIVEFKVRRLYYISAIGISIVAAAVCVNSVPYFTLESYLVKMVGFSAVVWALTIMTLGVLIRYGRLTKPIFWVTVCLLCIIIFDGLLLLLFEKVTIDSGLIATVLAQLGLCSIFLAWIFRRSLLYVLIPVVSMLHPLSPLIHTQGAHPAEIGHLAGALVGMLFLFPIYRSEVTREKPVWLRWRRSDLHHPDLEDLPSPAPTLCGFAEEQVAEDAHC